MYQFVLFAPSTRKDKKYMLTIVADGDDKPKTFHFGSKTSQTYLDHKDKTKRENYILRHKKRENWDEINAGSLSRYILWGDNTELGKNLKDYFKKFNIKK